MAFYKQDLTTYTEVDTGGHITVTADPDPDRAIIISDPAGDQGYVYADKGVNYFDGDFIHKFTLFAQLNDSREHESLCVHWGVANVIPGGAGDSILVSSTAGDRPDLGELYIFLQGTDMEEDIWNGAAASTPYYLTVDRSGTTITCKIYSDEERIDVLHLLATLVSEKDVVQYRYIYALQSLEHLLAVRRDNTGCYTEDLYIDSNGNGNGNGNGGNGALCEDIHLFVNASADYSTGDLGLAPRQGYGVKIPPNYTNRRQYVQLYGGYGKNFKLNAVRVVVQRRKQRVEAIT